MFLFLVALSVLTVVAYTQALLKITKQRKGGEKIGEE